MLTIEQCRAARGLLGWTQQDLADASGLSKTAINNFEKGHSDIKAESLRAIRMAFESLDIEFIGVQGLKKCTESLQIFRGPQAYALLLGDIGETLEKTDKGSELLILNPGPDFAAALAPDRLAAFHEILEKNAVRDRTLCAEGLTAFTGPYGLSRLLPKTALNASPSLFVYGPKIALPLWGGRMIVLISSPEAANAERERFEHLWAASPMPAQNSTARVKRDSGV